MEEILSHHFDNTVIEANKENLTNLTQSINQLFDNSNSLKMNPVSLREAVTNTIVSVAKKTHEIVETKQKLLTEEKMAKLNDLLARHEVNYNDHRFESPQTCNSNNSNESCKKTFQTKIETSEVCKFSV